MKNKIFIIGLILLGFMISVNAEWTFIYDDIGLFQYNDNILFHNYNSFSGVQLKDSNTLCFLYTNSTKGHLTYDCYNKLTNSFESHLVSDILSFFYDYDLAIDYDGKAHVCFMTHDTSGGGTEEGQIYYAYQDSNNDFVVNISDKYTHGYMSGKCSIDVDSNNNPHIAYSLGYSPVGNFERYKNGGTWTTVTIGGSVAKTFRLDIIGGYKIFSYLYSDSPSKLGVYYSTSIYSSTYTSDSTYNLTSYKGLSTFYDEDNFYVTENNYTSQNTLIGDLNNILTYSKIDMNTPYGCSIGVYNNKVYCAYTDSTGVRIYSDNSGTFQVDETFGDFYSTASSTTLTIDKDNGNKWIVYTASVGGIPYVKVGYEPLTLSIYGRVYDNSISTKPSISNARVCFNTINTTNCENTDIFGYYYFTDIYPNVNYMESVTKSGFVSFNQSVNLAESLSNNDIGLVPIGTTPNINYTSVRFEFKWESNNSAVSEVTINFKLNTFYENCASNYPFTTSSSGTISTSLPKGDYTLTLPSGYYSVRIGELLNAWDIDLNTQTNYIYSYILRRVDSFNYTGNIKVISTNDNKPLENVLVYLYNTETEEEYSAYTNSTGDIVVGFSECNNNVNYILTKSNYSTTTGSYQFYCYNNPTTTLYMNKAEYTIMLRVIDYDTFNYVQNYSVRIYCPSAQNCIDGKTQLIKDSDINGEITFYPQLVGRYILTTIPSFVDYPFFNPDTKEYYYDFSLEIGSTKSYLFNLYVRNKERNRDVYGNIKLDSSLGVGIDNVAISILSEDGENYYTTITNSSGGYYVENMSTNKYYSISLSKSGYSYPSGIGKYSLYLNSLLLTPFKYDMWLIIINTTNKYNYTVKGIVKNCDSNLTLEYSDVLIQCEYSHFNDFFRTSSDGVFNFTVLSYINPETCIIQITALNSKLEVFKQTFTLSGEKDFGTICLNETSLQYPLELCFVNNKNCLVNPLNCEVDSIYNIPNVNVSLTLVNSNTTSIKRAISSESGCVSFSNVVYGDYTVDYLSNYFEGGEDSFRVDENSVLYTNGRFYKLYKLEPKFQLYTLDVHIYYVENLTYINFTSGRYPLANAKVTLYDIDREIIILQEVTDNYGFILKEGLPNSNYRITVEYSGYKTQTAEFVLSTLTGTTKKYYEFTFLFTKETGEKHFQDVLLEFLTGDYVLYGVLGIFAIFGIYIIVLMLSGIYDNTIGKFTKK
jgi:hypothetical protein